MDLIGKTLGNYQIVSELGRGGMGVVYRAYQTSLNRYVAIKVLLPQLAVDETFVQRFLHEARASAQLQHPNIVVVYDVGFVEHIYYIVMAEIRGEPLSALVRRSGRLPLDRVVSIVSQVALALDFAHTQGIVHRDIKPSNILVDANDRAVLTDFGIAKAATGTGVTRTGMAVGTPEYMSPEQARGATVDHRSDLYSLGVIAYELMGGQAPFVGDILAVLHAHVYEPPPSLRALNPQVSKDVERVIAQAMAKKPEERWPSAGAFAAALAVSAQQAMPKIMPKRGKGASTPVPTPRGTPAPGATPAPQATAPPQPRAVDEGATILASSPPMTPVVVNATAVKSRSPQVILVASVLAVVAMAVVFLLLAGGNRQQVVTISGAGDGRAQMTELPVVSASAAVLNEARSSVPEATPTVVLEPVATSAQPTTIQAQTTVTSALTTTIALPGDIATPTLSPTATPTATQPKALPTDTPTSAPPTPVASAVPTLLLPVNGWSDPADAVRFQWQPVSGAMGFVVETRPENANENAWYRWKRIDGTSLTLSYDAYRQYFSTPGTVYLWRVGALNSAGKVVGYSKTRRFVFRRSGSSVTPSPLPTQTPSPTDTEPPPPPPPTDTPEPPPPSPPTDTPEPPPPTDTPEPPPPPPPTDTPEPPPPPPPTDTPEPPPPPPPADTPDFGP